MSWLTKQFRSVKKKFIPKEVRKPFTEIGQAMPEEVTGLWDDAMKGSKQMGNAIAFWRAADDKPFRQGSGAPSKEDKAAAEQAAFEEANPVRAMPDEESIRKTRRRNASRRQGLGRASTVFGSDAETLG